MNREFPEAFQLIQRHKRIDVDQLVEVDGVVMEVSPTVLSPSLTSTSGFFSEKLICRNLEGSIFEVGVGTGFNLIRLGLASRKLQLFGGDINPDAVQLARRNFARVGLSASIHQSDLFSAVKGCRFDSIIFNPPLLHGDPQSTLEAAIFDPGGETIDRFLQELRSHLSPRGCAYILYTNRYYQATRESGEQYLKRKARLHDLLLTISESLDRGYEIYTIWELRVGG